MAKKRSSSSTTNSRKKSTSSSKRPKVTPPVADVEEYFEDVEVEDEDQVMADEEEEDQSHVSPSRKIQRKTNRRDDDLDCRFLGEPIPADEASSRWPHRYLSRKSLTMKKGEKEYIQANLHYLKAEVDGGVVFELNDDAHVESGDAAAPFICKILEIFEGIDGLPYFRARWYYRAKDTVIREAYTMREAKRIFLSDVEDDNPLDCLVSKIIEVALAAGDSDTSTCSEEEKKNNERKSTELRLLDLYSGCGAMSTGLCLGANLSGINLVTKWAVDINEHACESLKLNHPETEVRNETVDDFLMLLKEWRKLCASYSLIESAETHQVIDAMGADDGDDVDGEDGEEEESNGDEVFEVDQILGICYGKPKPNTKVGLYFQVRWKGYGLEEDTWEPVDGLGNCRESIGKFVKNAFNNKALPLPGDVDVVCGGPPCQGLSGFNRFRNKEKPLDDSKNKQLLVYMDVVDYLKPRFLLMENVVDLFKFSNAFCGRYALGRLVDMNYQVRMGMMAAGAYGLPQFRMRVFMWGARPTERLPQYPLPTHDLVCRGFVPKEFDDNTVAYGPGDNVQLEAKLLLGDAISDLPPVNNDESRDKILYGGAPLTDFQRFIRLTKEAMTGSGTKLSTTLYDHRPLRLNADDYQRVCKVPKEKGANFRNFPGVIVMPDNKVKLDPEVKRELLPSGKPLVPDYAITFVRGTSSKPFARLWYDETVPTVVTRAEPHNQAVCHPFQDRVLTIRENARLQGFPDYYQLKGPIKERYIQVGNAVAVPVARALGYSLALAIQGSIDEKHLLTLPTGFPQKFLDKAIPPSVDIEDYTEQSL